jgi:hypothetical protein
MGQFTKIQRDLKAGITETITVSGSFLYMTKAVGFVRTELYNRDRADVSEVIMQEGFTWSEDPNLLNSFTSIIVTSPIDQQIVLLAGFGRITNESVVIKTTEGVPIDVNVVNDINKPALIKSYNRLYTTKPYDMRDSHHNIKVIKDTWEKLDLISDKESLIRFSVSNKRLWLRETNTSIMQMLDIDVKDYIFMKKNVEYSVKLLDMVSDTQTLFYWRCDV